MYGPPIRLNECYSLFRGDPGRLSPRLQVELLAQMLSYTYALGIENYQGWLTILTDLKYEQPTDRRV